MHTQRFLPLALVAAFGAIGGVAAQPPLTAADHTSIEEITVTGRYPGPPLWKVTSADHSLWIFGELSPVPKGLDWDPRNAERALERADAVIAAPRVNAPTYNPLKLVRVFRAARRLTRLDGDATLADTLPPELDARYRALRSRYLPRERDDDLRPVMAALRLYNAALDDVDLTSDSKIGATLRRMMRRSRTDIAEPQIKTDPNLVLAELEKVTREAELSCFASVLTTIETDLDGMKERARAWATGDVDALQRFDYPDSRGDCLAMLFSAGGLANLRDELYATWLNEAERALAAHSSTFSVLPMRELVAPDGLLAALAARGYTVTPP